MCFTPKVNPYLESGHFGFQLKTQCLQELFHLAGLTRIMGLLKSLLISCLFLLGFLEFFVVSICFFIDEGRHRSVCGDNNLCLVSLQSRDTDV